MDLRERLQGKMTEEELDHLVTAFDIVGDVAIIKVPDQLAQKKGVIADAVMAQHNHVTTVLRKTGERAGEYRVADYELLRGKDAETLHKEHGCRFVLDPTAVYFSERLGHERERVMAQVADGEVVVDMFAGVGPFAITVARNTDAAHVHAFEKNPDAVAYLRQNMELNDVTDTVSVYAGDVRNTLPGQGIAADRVIMNLPKSADAFLDVAAQTVAPGTIIHFYRFVAKDDLWDAAVADVEHLFAGAGLDAAVVDHAICGHYNPAVERACFDVEVYGNDENL